ncbi:MAG TPA: energy-coupling factor transporter transmembrane component T [Gemmatimonadales bacterium]|nr:energy-coupling factor transporter transmembrane component T [Gemmatimonadales bacterium]
MTPVSRAAAGRLHPFTPLVLTVCVAVLAVAAPGPQTAAALYGVTLLAVAAAGVGRAALRALVPLAPLWLFLFLLHAILGEGDQVAVLGLSLSRDGLALAVTQACRLGAIATASLALYASFSPARFVDAVAERGWSFSWAYLVVATLLALPRFRARAVAILEAQRSRGLRLRGSLLNRVRAVGPVTFPLLLGALAEVDERGFALESRCASGVTRRTPLDPPRDSLGDRVGRWLAGALAVAAVLWRVLR